MNLPYAIAATLAALAAAIHGGAGERLVVRKLRVDTLAPTPFGGPETTLLLIRATWHLLTATFLVMAIALGTCAALEPGGACRGAGLLASGTFGLFAAGTLTALAVRHRLSLLVRHPAPLVFALVAGLSWWGA